MEMYIFNEDNTVSSNIIENKKLTKREVVAKFRSYSLRNDCLSIEKKENENEWDYLVKVISKNEMRIRIHKEPFNEENYSIMKELDQYAEKFNNRKNKVIRTSIGIIIVVTAAASVLAGSIKLTRNNKTLGDVIVDWDNKQFDQQIESSMEVMEQHELEQMHNEALQQYQMDKMMDDNSSKGLK